MWVTALQNSRNSRPKSPKSQGRNKYFRSSAKGIKSPTSNLKSRPTSLESSSMLKSRTHKSTIRNWPTYRRSTASQENQVTSQVSSQHQQTTKRLKSLRSSPTSLKSTARQHQRISSYNQQLPVQDRNIKSSPACPHNVKSTSLRSHLGQEHEIPSLKLKPRRSIFCTSAALLNTRWSQTVNIGFV